MNRYNPNIHHRRSIRLKGYEYAQAGLYFITICCQDRICRFGKNENGETVLNEYGQIAHDEWMKLPNRFGNFEMDIFQIMPNHMHGIIVLNPVGATLAVAPNDGDAVAPNDGDAVAPNDGDAVAPNDANASDNIMVNVWAGRAGASPAPTVGDIVGAYKSLVATKCLKIHKSKNEIMGKLWQRNYYEHIIRNERSYQTISNYIINNPKKWKEDKFYKRTYHHN